MYSYWDSMKKNVRAWIDEHEEELKGLDRQETYDVCYDEMWVSDSVTGNASGSYTFSRYKARENFFTDENSEDYISEMIEDGFTSDESVGRAVRESQWELIDVTIRCWLLCQVLSVVLDEVFED